MKPICDIRKGLFLRLRGCFYILALNAFLVILLFILIELVFGSFVFYKYVFLSKRAAPSIEGKVLKFDAANYEKVMTIINK